MPDLGEIAEIVGADFVIRKFATRAMGIEGLTQVQKLQLGNIRDKILDDIALALKECGERVQQQARG